ncbi:cytochrome aa3 quinol oxidase subunit IV [Paenibacillus lautus]|jgi:cytochrome aa3-600 menaquinol oxidase subunit 4|uniref:Quinol oxidase subunit 4 n=1 Tax=Paenibacillus lautus TaxID=1401 RepID=A0A2A5LRJ2_PAELA|nr:MULTISPECIES: cytochrome aa3 quinol oxidase subunit IV [Paenibacillus]MBY0162222.1 cytochrome aa3 quinol oxidase subunit IV [Cytobacillus firmus]VTR50087.1 Quinol oxidase subunit 4 [Actinobacillus pleuropneumoniae]ACX64770.1 cytochrome aa3 quinol oxidase, subunit IV [Paenibacillus sp. Y412MC10]AYB44903.1 cytochrome aa3 quinol oxidase subunit IV [Paenibacillus lautus]EGG38447.1 cytochrome aa3 quinol oxidase, subunit IV [Paenibacillus sp. HGF5]
MLKQLFPIKHVAGYISSLVLSAVALVVLLDMPAASKVAVLLVTAILQAAVQLMLFMHVGESEDKKSVYINIAFALFVGLVTIFGTLFIFIWGWYA